MFKSDLDARPMFNRMRDAIAAHLTMVFAALAVSPAIPDAERKILTDPGFNPGY